MVDTDTTPEEQEQSRQYAEARAREAAQQRDAMYRPIALLLAVLLSACASAPAAQRQFQDGAPMRAPIVEPRTTYTPQGAGLPEYWGQPQDATPRSPHKRVLPPSKEPGLYAVRNPWLGPGTSDGPPGWRDRWPSVIGVDLLTSWDISDDMSEDDKQAFLLYIENTRACAYIADTGLTTLYNADVFTSWRPSERRCLVTALHSICAVKDRARFESAIKHASKEQRAKAEYARKAFDRSVEVAKKSNDDACGVRGAFSSRVMDAYNGVVLKWETFDWRWSAGL